MDPLKDVYTQGYGIWSRKTWISWSWNRALSLDSLAISILSKWSLQHESFRVVKTSYTDTECMKGMNPKEERPKRDLFPNAKQHHFYYILSVKGMSLCWSIFEKWAIRFQFLRKASKEKKLVSFKITIVCHLYVNHLHSFHTQNQLFPLTDHQIKSFMASGLGWRSRISSFKSGPGIDEAVILQYSSLIQFSTWRPWSKETVVLSTPTTPKRQWWDSNRACTIISSA